jgi:hypothetical protein
MKSKILANEGCIKFCSALQWNWMQFLPWAAGMTVAEVDKKFTQWIGEIEKADGTMGFRWARIIPRDGNVREFYAMVGGLGSGAWWVWTRRWATINGNRELRAGLIYGFPREKRRIAPVLQELLVGKKFDFEMRMGPKTISRSRKLELDEFGMPLGGEALLIPTSRQNANQEVTCEQLTFSYPRPLDSAKVPKLTVRASKSTDRSRIR